MRRARLLLMGFGVVGAGIAVRAAQPATTVPLPDGAPSQVRSASGTLELLSINLAHGRATAMSHLLVSEAGHRRNLDQVRALIAEQGAHLVALQEADGPSWWSGGFDHPGSLGEPLGMAVAHGIHVDALGLRYGTAMLSSVPFTDGIGHTFGSPGPTPSKGFTLVTVQLDGRPVDVVSVHLDFASGWVRRRQLAELAALLQRRARPVVLLGDFNMEAEALHPFVRAQQLRTHAVGPTFPTMGTGIDHILVSEQLDIVDARALDVAVSDHLPLRASVRWTD